VIRFEVDGSFMPLIRNTLASGAIEIIEGLEDSPFLAHCTLALPLVEQLKLGCYVKVRHRAEPPTFLFDGARRRTMFCLYPLWLMKQSHADRSL
jgi:hypothetical protein